MRKVREMWTISLLMIQWKELVIFLQPSEAFITEVEKLLGQIQTEELVAADPNASEIPSQDT